MPQWGGPESSEIQAGLNLELELVEIIQRESWGHFKSLDSKETITKKFIEQRGMVVGDGEEGNQVIYLEIGSLAWRTKKGLSVSTEA